VRARRGDDRRREDDDRRERFEHPSHVRGTIARARDHEQPGARSHGVIVWSFGGGRSHRPTQPSQSTVTDGAEKPSDSTSTSAEARPCMQVHRAHLEHGRAVSRDTDRAYRARGVADPIGVKASLFILADERDHRLIGVDDGLEGPKRFEGLLDRAAKRGLVRREPIHRAIRRQKHERPVGRDPDQEVAVRGVRRSANPERMSWIAATRSGGRSRFRFVA